MSTTRKRKVAAESTGTTSMKKVEAVKETASVEVAKETTPVKEEVKEQVKEEAVCASAKKAPVVPDVFVQYMGKDVSVAETTEAVKRVWTEEMGHKEEEIESLSLYFRTEINRAYFVINGEASGSVEI